MSSFHLEWINFSQTFVKYINTTKSKTNSLRKYFLICWQNIQQQWQTILIKLVQKCRFPVPGVCGWYWPKDRGQWGLWRQIKSDWLSFSQIRHNMWCSVIRRTYIFISLSCASNVLAATHSFLLFYIRCIFTHFGKEGVKPTCKELLEEFLL